MLNTEFKLTATTNPSPIKKAAANAAAKEDVGSRSYKSTSKYTG
jgi:transaldolase